MLTVSLLVNPVAWSHYVVLLIIPVNIIARTLRDAAYPKHLLLNGCGLYLINLHFTGSAILGLIWLLRHMDFHLTRNTQYVIRPLAHSDSYNLK